MNKKILLINDLAGYGKVALSAMIPILSHKGHSIYTLPTALVSNTLDYGKFEILDTTDYMEKTIKVWEELGFTFDIIATGFITSERQAQLVRDFCIKQKEEGACVFVDPIMGDEGKLYNGIENERVESFKKLVSIADFIVPNYTEASLLAGKDYKEVATDDDILGCINALKDIGGKSVVITSIRKNEENIVATFNHKTKIYYQESYEEIPARFPGTGDIFAARMICDIADGIHLEDGVGETMSFIENMILDNLHKADKFKGLPVEQYLGE